MVRRLKLKSLEFDGSQLTFNPDQFNKEVFYPIVKSAHDMASTIAQTHMKTGELYRNTRMWSLAKHNTGKLGYALIFGKRTDYTNSNPHFVFYNHYQQGRERNRIIRSINKQISYLNGD